MEVKLRRHLTGTHLFLLCWESLSSSLATKDDLPAVVAMAFCYLRAGALRGGNGKRGGMRPTDSRVW